MKVAVIMPVRNAEKYLEKTIQSIIAQSHEDWVLIAIDDNSSDESQNILIKYANEDRRILWSISGVNFPSGNPADVRNQALDLVFNVDLIAYCDADDRWDNHHLKTAIQVFEATGCDMTYSDCSFEDEAGNPATTWGVPYYNEFSIENLKKQNFIYISTVVHRAKFMLPPSELHPSLFNGDGFRFDSKCVPQEDYDMWLRIASVSNGEKVKHIQYKTATYLCKETSYYTNEQSIKSMEVVHKKNSITKDMRVLATISTKGRYFTTLPMAIMAVCMQTEVPEALYLFDDNDSPIDLSQNEIFRYLMMQLDINGIKFKLFYGKKRGQHYNHQWANEIAKEEGFDCIWRLDDDTAPEPNVLHELLNFMDENDGVGAVGGSVLTPPIQRNEISATGLMKKIKIEPNLQWGVIYNAKEVDHLHCSYLHKVGIADYNLKLSKVAHREESLHTWAIKKAGYKLFVIPNCVTWHYKNSHGGIRSHTEISNYQHDEGIFEEELSKDGISTNWKLIVLDNGLGDHWAFKHILAKLKLRHKNIQIACCYPDVFYDEPEIEIISIAKAKEILGSSFENYNVYSFMQNTFHKGNLVDAFEKMYL